MGDSARTKRREQLRRWDGSCTDLASAVARRRWRSDAENGQGEPEAELGEPIKEHSDSGSREETGPVVKKR